MLYDCKTNNQSQKRCTMDSLEEKDKPAPKLSKSPRIEVDEELMRQMIAGQAPLDSKVVRRIPEPEEGAEETAQEPVPKSEVDESSPSVVPAAVAAGKDVFGFRRKKLTLPDFERTFFAPVDCRNRLRSMSAPKPSAKCRQSSTCWETTQQGLHRWSTVCCGSLWAFTATN